MSTNLATILVGLGYDLSALEKGSPEAFRLINEQTLKMSSEMKRNARDGAEAFRSIDEMIGIHINRPMTRLLVETFPAFGKALSDVIGGVAFGAVAFAGYEVFERVAQQIEKATKAQEALREATANVEKVFAEEMAAYERKDKAIAASTTAVDKLAEAEMKQIKAAEDAAGPWNRALAAVGEFAHEITSFQSTLNIEEIDKQLSAFLDSYNKLALQDSIHGTANAAALLTQQLSDANKQLDELVAKRAHQSYREVPLLGTGLTIGNLLPGQGTTQAEVDAAQRLVDALGKLQQVQNTTQQGVRDEQARADALKRASDAAKALSDFYREIGDGLKKFQPETDPLKKLRDELDATKVKAQADFFQMAKYSDDALALTAAREHLRTFEAALDGVYTKAKAAADLAAAAANLPKSFASTTAAPTFGSSNVLPILGAGGSTAEQLDAFMKDTTAQLKLAAQAYQDAITPAQKFDLTKKELGDLLEKHLIDLPAYTVALQNAREEMQKAGDAMEKLIEKGGVAGGLKAFWQQLQTPDETSGRFAFDTLNKGLQSFQDETAKALSGARVSWQSFFQSIDQMALKFMLNGLIASLFSGSLFKGFGGMFGLGGAGGGTAAASAGGGGFFGEGAFSAAAAFPGFASGTDYSPGGLSWVGESGPELVNLPQGSSVTPASALRGSPNVAVHIDARGAELGVEDKIARAISEWTPHVVMRAVVESSEMQRRSLSK